MVQQISRQKRRIPPTILGAIVCAALLASAASHAGVINIPADQPTIQAGINAASNGDEIVIAPGSYFELINFNGKQITVRSTNPNDPAVVAATIINGNGAGTVVRCISGEGPGSVLAGLTITGGNAGITILNGGGMVINAASPTISRCRFIDNFAYTSGGAIYCLAAANPTIEHCVFADNEAGSGGGIFSSGASPIIRYCSFTGNQAYDDVGGGVFCHAASTVTFVGCIFANNVAPDTGGAGVQGCTALFTACQFIGNSAETCAGGLGSYFNAVTTVSGCTFMANQAPTCAAAIRNLQSTLTLTNSLVCSNGANQIEGGFTNGGGNTISQGCPAPEPVGACCLAGHCVAVTQSQCVSAGGAYQGDGALCSSADCQAPPSCPADVAPPGGDGAVNVSDLLSVISAWGACP